MRLSGELPLVGWREWATLPELGLGRIAAKIDTGARSCALHAEWQRELVVDGIALVAFALRESVDGPIRELRAPIAGRRVVSDTGGGRDVRVFIRSRLRLGDWEREVEIGLTNRHGLRHRMLIGRAALAGHWRVDPGSTFLLGTGEVQP